ncbi:MAG: hypothetical protein A2020_02400 [Lentisphaerae bacterium GWF2_45_14]|nr:MAG: hypothetical protein A2020_02400 [Lentisphaerae bacterium GWF2_45_14]
MLLPEFTPENVALNKPCSFSEPPSYKLCSDPADSKQLTDGRYCQRATADGDFYFWTQKGTVGWKKLKKPVEISIDLGEIKPISGASIRTAAGRESVLWPGALEMLVSDDNSKFYYVADLTETKRYSFPFRSGVYGIYNYKNDELRTRGRYIKFRCFPTGFYFFCDEIEVYSGPSEFLKNKDPGREVSGDSLERLLITKGMKNRMFSDIIELEKMTGKLSPLPGEKGPTIKERLQLLWNEVSQFEFKGTPATVTAVIPLNGLHERIIAMHSVILNRSGFKGIILRHKDRYERLSLFAAPSDEPPAVNVRLMNGEYRADTLNISNCTDKKRKISFSVKGLPDQTHMKIYKVCGIDTREKIIDFSALVEIEPEKEVYETTAEAGMTTQLWFSFNPVSVKQGKYEAEISFSGGDWKGTVPLTLTVSSMTFSEKPGLKTMVWDYLLPPQYGITDGNAAQAVDLMKKHFVTVATASAAVAGLPSEKDVDARGDIIKKLDFSTFDRWVALWPGAEIYHIYLEQSVGQALAGKSAGTPEFERVVSQWVREIAAHASSKGIKPSHLQFNILDEPSAPDHYKFLKHWAKAVKSVDTGVTLFCDPAMMTKEGYMKYASETLAYMDIISTRMNDYIFELPKEIKSYFQKRIDGGTEFWFYMYSEPVRQFDPAYFRLQPWQAFAGRAIGSGFWSFADIGTCASNWNPYSIPSGYDYSPVYITPTTITPAKQLEALREGIEDYQYLLMLKSGSKEKNLSTSIASHAIEEAAKKAGSAKYWLNWQDNYSACSAAEKARLEILDLLEKKTAK